VKRIHFVAATVAVLHLLGVLLTAYFVSHSSAAQAPLAWVYWMFIDLPWSWLYWTMTTSGSLGVFHGVIGTAWWYILLILIGKLITAIRQWVGARLR
jgi:hypothetical protein